MTASQFQPRTALLLAATLSPLSLIAQPALAAERRAGSVAVQVTQMIAGLEEPWAIEFLPDGQILVSEIDGRLLRISEGEAMIVPGTPEVWESGQGGLLDIMIPRDFAESREVFLSYSKPMRGGAGTALGVGRLIDGALVGFRDLFTMANGSRRSHHFGSRIVEAPDGTLFLTVGERGERDAAQDLSRANGKVLRLNRDGSIPADNPFTGSSSSDTSIADSEEALSAIWSYGHRNPQGAALDADGQLWINEHGPQGGDEINRVEKGGNYGWPLTSFGENYGGGRFAPTALSGTVAPSFQWTPSIAPSGHAIYQGELFPALKGAHLIGSLKFDYIAVMAPETWEQQTWDQQTWQWPETGRVRDIKEAPDGSIWFLSVIEGAAYRISPAQ
ncbi:PQQ-dependent sugar dehydrogenase [Celeribacter neptunius]|uniref:Glucose/arabinose dehydrogenase, beta-propeller fold n=1 Tax=Celeribacter neptunius TaxID=588602 RepID=A0A1I3L021_9RHOB|nr:PQQ-dependent sugar dehydrogenase [Celeribacter neptunius]SFI78069.1 Glucose/arabinose dehydrogenase, beta-propeller fold [Celeribacter neptunius]